jgi:fatty acid desaturase
VKEREMSRAVVGLMAGMALGFAAYFGNFWAFLLVLGMGLVGLVIGRFTEGDLEPGDFVRRRERQDRIRDDRRQARGDWRR